MRSPRRLVRDTITGRFTRRARAESAPTITVTETTTPSERLHAAPLSAKITTHGLQVRVRLHAGLTPVHTAGLECDDTADALAQVRHALALLNIREDRT